MACGNFDIESQTKVNQQSLCNIAFKSMLVCRCGGIKLLTAASFANGRIASDIIVVIGGWRSQSRLEKLDYNLSQQKQQAL